MKKIIGIFLCSFLLFSCNDNSDINNQNTQIDEIVTNENDAKINTETLLLAYNNDFHELYLANMNLNVLPDFEKYLTGTIVDDIWSIDLHQNNLTNIDFEKLKYFPNLEELNLSYNNISEITVDHPFISKLLLHKNKLTNIKFEGQNKINELNLGYNEFNSLKGINIPETLKTIELQHNKLEDLDGIEKLNNLEVLKFEFNNLDDNDMIVLKNLKNLKNISYGKNNLSEAMETGLNKYNELKN